MDEDAEMIQIYDAINRVWLEAGLMMRRVMDTPRHENAVAALRKYWQDIGTHDLPEGPISGDIWFIWIRRLSFCLEDRPSLANAKLEQNLQKLAIDALAEGPAPSASVGGTV